jgi:eukaryotic-like serine/threonine-protein kinase
LLFAVKAAVASPEARVAYVTRLRKLLQEVDHVSSEAVGVSLVTSNAAANPRVDRDLQTICLKCLQKEPERRYASAEVLAEDLERYLKDEPIRARRITFVQRVQKWTRRHQSVAWTAGLSLVAMLLLAVVGLVTSNVLIKREKAQTDVAREELERTLYYQRVALAERELKENKLNRVERLLDACPAHLRGWEWHYVKGLRLQGLSPMRHPTSVFSAVFSRDGRSIVSASHDGKVTVSDATTGQQLFAFPPGGVPMVMPPGTY